MKISALISTTTASYRIEQIDAQLDTLQKIVGGYIEAVLMPDGTAHLYCNEEGKIAGKATNRFSTNYLDVVYLQHAGRRFSDHDILVGDILWLGDDGSGESVDLPIEHINGFTRRTFNAVEGLTVIRQGAQAMIMDTDPTSMVSNLATTTRTMTSVHHPTIEVYPGLTRAEADEITNGFGPDVTVERVQQ